MPNISNLKPFTGADDPRRQNGRTKGSKNLSTIVIELLGEEMNPDILVGEGPQKYLGNSPTTYMKALAKAMIAKAIEKYGRVDVLVNNAGISSHSKLEEFSVEEYDRIADLNIKAVFICSKVSVPYLKETKGVNLDEIN